MAGGNRTTFTGLEVEEIRRLLDELPEARLGVRRMNLARLRRIQLGIVSKTGAFPTRAEFEALVASGAVVVDESGIAARAVVRPHPSGNVFRVAVGVTGSPISETWSAFDQRYQWFGRRPQSVTSGAHMFVLAVDRWRSAVVGLYETVTAGADKLPNSPDSERWPWALGVRPLAAIPPPDAERVDGQRGPQSGLPARISDQDALGRLYRAVADSPPPPGPRTPEQRVQELEWQDVAADVLRAVRLLGKEARGPVVVSRAIALGEWTVEDLEARAWYTGSGVVSHVEYIVRQALQREHDLRRHLTRTHGIYSVTGATPGDRFGTDYRRATDSEDDPAEPPTRVVDLSELDRATRRHKHLQDKLADALRDRGIEPRSPDAGQPQFDLAFHAAGRRFVVEVKSGNPVTRQQMRLGAGQLLEYRHQLDDGSAELLLVLLLETEPPEPWSILARELEIRLLRADQLKSSLTNLLRPP